MSDEEAEREEVDADNDRLLEIVKAYCAQLAEHFDTVQIFVNRHPNDGVGSYGSQWGSGNWFARYGHVKDWIVKVEERTRCDVRREEEK